MLHQNERSTQHQVCAPQYWNPSSSSNCKRWELVYDYQFTIYNKPHFCNEPVILQFLITGLQGGNVARVRRYFYTCPLDCAKWATLCGRQNSSWARCSNGRPLEEEDYGSTKLSIIPLMINRKHNYKYSAAGPRILMDLPPLCVASLPCPYGWITHSTVLG
jgi:hypothetical protein